MNKYVVLMLCLGAVLYAGNKVPDPANNVRSNLPCGAVPESYQPARVMDCPVVGHMAPANGAMTSPFWTHPALLDTAYVQAYATDYDPLTDRLYAVVGTYWDSLIKVYSSTDEGYTWNYDYYIWFSPASLYRKLGLVIARGDSNFMHVFLRHDINNGDIYDFRVNLDNASTSFAGVWTGADTVDNFSVCKDYRSNYGLYVAAANEQRGGGGNGRILVSQDFGKTWSSINWSNGWENSISAGADRSIHVASVETGRTGLFYEMNTNFGDPSYWGHFAFVQFDTFYMYKPKVISALTSPDSEANAWIVYQKNWYNTNDWDVWYAFRSHAWGDTWRRTYAISATGTLREVLPDLNNYKLPGYTWIGAALNIADTGYTYMQTRWTYTRDTTWITPELASDTFQYTDYWLGPRMVGPSSHDGVMFPKGGTLLLPHGVYYNAALLGIERGGQPRFNSLLRVYPNPARGVVSMAPLAATRSIGIYDMAGKLVKSFSFRVSPGLVTWDGQDARGFKVSPGVYVVRTRTDKGTASGKLLLVR